MSKCNQKLCHQSELILSCCLLLIKSTKVDIKVSLNDWFLVSVNIPCLFSVSFPFLLNDIGDVSNKLVSAHYVIHLKMKVKLVALVSNLKHTA